MCIEAIVLFEWLYGLGSSRAVPLPASTSCDAPSIASLREGGKRKACTKRTFTDTPQLTTTAPYNHLIAPTTPTF